MTAWAVIGGSRAYDLLREGGVTGERIDPVVTPFGLSQPVFRCRTENAEFLFLSRHGEHGYQITASAVNYRANIYALKALGTERIIAWSGPGGIAPDLEAGAFFLPDDLLDQTRRPATFFTHGRYGFIRQNPVFCPDLRRRLAAVLARQGLPHRATGTYVCTEGPRLETPAEIRHFAAAGADAVGMTLAPECFLARELEMCYAPLCYISNRAEAADRPDFQAGVLFEGLLSEEEHHRVEAAVRQLLELVAAVLQEDEAGDCSCRRSMERYRRRGDLPPAWQRWVEP
jgi:5'-methylthioadenosine phosphorylase